MPLDSFSYKNYTIEVSVDDDPENPRTDQENLGVMACKHDRYTLGDSNGMEELLQYSEGLDHEYKSEAMLAMEKLISAEAVILPLHLYDHSGITMSTSAFSDRWDAGQVGVIFVTQERLKEQGLGGRSKEDIEEILKAEVNEYDQYITGQVYGFEIKDFKGESYDLYHGGFFGDYGHIDDDKPSILISQAKDIIDEAPQRSMYHCKKCGGTNISFEALVKQDQFGELYVEDRMGSGDQCEDCGGECSTEYREVEEVSG